MVWQKKKSSCLQIPDKCTVVSDINVNILNIDEININNIEFVDLANEPYISQIEDVIFAQIAEESELAAIVIPIAREISTNPKAKASDIFWNANYSESKEEENSSIVPAVKLGKMSTNVMDSDVCDLEITLHKRTI